MSTGKIFSLWITAFLSFCLAVTLSIGGFTSFYNWSGSDSWNKIAAELKAKGEPATWQEVVPPPVPDSENFCVTPLLACLNNYSLTPGTEGVVFAEPALVEKIKSLHFQKDKAPALGSFQQSQTIDLEGWQNYFRKNFALKITEGQSPAKAVLTAFDAYSKEINELHEAIAPRHC